MKRFTLFLAVLGGAVAGLAFVTAWYLESYQRQGGSVAGMMGQMMGSGNANGMAQPMPYGVWWSIVALVVLGLVGVAGLGYYLAFPEIRSGASPQPAQVGGELKGDPNLSWSVLMRTSKPEEKRVLEALASHDGTYLQKFVVKETGLSRLKTHRIVSRLAERGVVMVKKNGNTNELSLAPWVRKETSA